MVNSFTLAEYRIKVLAPITMSDSTATKLAVELDTLLKNRLTALSPEIQGMSDQLKIEIVK